jgi:Na+-transporting methylmalonyl-CoA/oxaloacetate decarboxylase gamma subunit
MHENLLNALIITVIGMGLVFGAILLLWGVMAVLVRWTAEPAGKPSTTDGPAADEAERRHRAAAVAVAYALAAQVSGTEPHEFPLPPTALVSAWQAVMRTRMLSKRGRTK